MRNAKAVWALVLALLALAVLGAGAGAAWALKDVGLYEAAGAVPVAGALALVAIVLGRRGRGEWERTLGRAGGRAAAGAGRALGSLALLVSITAALALGVFAVLVLALD